MKHRRFLLSAVLVSIVLLIPGGARTQPVPETPSPALIADRNVNMAGGPVTVETDADGNLAGLIEGDPFHQKQEELTVAVSSRNPRHLLAGANDYRAVNLPGSEAPPTPGNTPGNAATGDVWLGVFDSQDQGKHWRSTLLPGYPQDTSPEGLASPLKGFQAAADPVVRAGTHGLFYYFGIAFDRGTNALGAVFAATFMDLNNLEGVDFPLSLPAPAESSAPAFASSTRYVNATLIDQGTSGQFLDKIWAVVDKVRRGHETATISAPINCDPATNTACATADGADGVMDGLVTQTIPCGHAYVGYADFTGNPTNNPNSKMLVSRSTDCGQTWETPIVVNQTQGVSQGVVMAIRASDGRASIAWREFGLDGGLDAIWIAHQDLASKKKLKFDPAIRVAELSAASNTAPFDLATRATDQILNDPYRSFRVNTYPTLAIDDSGGYYVAWSQRGWGADVDQDGQSLDGARIVLKTSADGEVWGAVATPIDALPGEATEPRGHQIMPSLTFLEGRLALLFYDFREDVYPDILRRLKSQDCTVDENSDGNVDLVDCCIQEAGNPAAGGDTTPQDCERLGEPEFIESLIPADPANFAPLPVRHTLNTFMAEALPGADPTFAVTNVSQYTKVLVPKLDAQSGMRIPGEFELAQIRFHTPSLPLYGGDKGFIGDYIEINGSRIVPDPSDQFGWGLNTAAPPCKAGVDCAVSTVLHAAWADSRDVEPPLPTTEVDSQGRTVLRQDWTGEYLGIPGRARMLDQNPYTSRLNGGVVLGTPANFKPLFDLGTDQSRAFALILENTLNEGAVVASAGGNKWVRQSRFYRLTFELPTGAKAEASFTPFSTGGTDFLDVEIPSNSSIATTLFARLTAANGDKRTRITVYANELQANDTDGDSIPDALPPPAQRVFLSGGLQASVVLNPDGTNPLPVNVDVGGVSVLDEETHTPEFVPFNCAEFLDLTGPAGLPDGIADDPALLVIFPECGFLGYDLDGDGVPDSPDPAPGADPIWSEVLTLRTYWPTLVDSLNPNALNASLFNASLFNASLFNPAIYSASLFNPALADDSVLDWANASLFNASLFNASLFNASLFNASLFNASLFNPALSVTSASLSNASLFNASLFNASLFNASLFNASLFNASLFNASLFNASLLNASLFNASLFNASLFNGAVNEEVDGTNQGMVFPSEQVFNPTIFSDLLTGQGGKIIDLNWTIDNIGDTASGYFFAALVEQAPPNSQLLIRQVKPNQFVARDPDCLKDPPGGDGSNCGLKTFVFYEQEILANVLDLPSFADLDPSVLGNILLQSTFIAPPGGRTYATLRVACALDETGQVCLDGFDPGRVEPVIVPQATEDGLVGAWIVVESLDPTPAEASGDVTITAKVGSYSSSLPQGLVQFRSEGVAIGPTIQLDDLDPGGNPTGIQKATLVFTPLDFGFGAREAPYSLEAEYLPDPGFACGLGVSGTGTVPNCFSQAVALEVGPTTLDPDDVEFGIQLQVCGDGGTAGSGGTLASEFGGDPVEVCAQTTEASGIEPPLASDTGDFTVTYTTCTGPTLAECNPDPTTATTTPPTAAGLYQVVITINDPNFATSEPIVVALRIDKAAQTISFGPLPPTTFGDPPFSVSATASSGLPVGFSVSGPATIAGNVVTITGAGTVTVTASQAGDANYNAAPPVDQTIDVAKADQTITFDPLPAKTFGDPPFTVSATASSGLPVSFSVSGPATIAGNVVTITGAGTVTVTASQAGDANYNAAPPVDRIVNVAKADQTITFDPLPAKTFGDPPFTVTATASSGLPVSFSVSGPATIAGNLVTITGAGTVTVTASQPGDADYNAAVPVDRAVSVARADQVISFDPLPAKTFGDPPFTVVATASSGLPVGFSVSGPATIAGNLVTITGAGTVTVTAFQPGDADYNAAVPVARVVSVAKADQTISFDPLPDREFGDPPFTVVATASSGLPVGFSVAGPATIDGDVVTLTGAGEVTVTASQPGDANYNAAPDVPQSFNVSFVTFVGFGPPVGPGGSWPLTAEDPIPFIGAFSQNKTLTLKWNLSQAGVPQTDLDLIHSIVLSPRSDPAGNSCPTDVGPSPLPEDQLYPTCASSNFCAGGTELRVSDRYIFNWKLTNVPSGCYTVFLNLGSALDDLVAETWAATLEVR